MLKLADHVGYSENIEIAKGNHELKDLDDVNEETVSHWLDDNADLFGINIPAQSNADNVSLAALRQQDIVTQGAVTPEMPLYKKPFSGRNGIKFAN